MIKTVDVQPDSKGKYVCPECQKELNDRAHLGIHRKLAHKVSGTTNPYRKKGYGPARTSISPQVISQILKMAATGMSGHKIAQALGISHASVYKYIKRASHRGPGRPRLHERSERGPNYKMKQPIVLRAEDITPEVSTLKDRLQAALLAIKTAAGEVLAISEILGYDFSEDDHQ